MTKLRKMRIGQRPGRRSVIAGHLYPNGRLTRAAYILKRQLLALQGHTCKICLTAIPKENLAHLDHNHKTKELRGVLCRACNLGLGQFYDNPVTLRLAADYLDTYG